MSLDFNVAGFELTAPALVFHIKAWQQDRSRSGLSDWQSG